jgi:hypothetical protein
MISQKQIGPLEYMELHSSKLHNDYHNFNTLFKNVISNGAEPGDLNAKASELIRTIQACANNGNRYAEARKKKKLMDTDPDIVIRNYGFGELLHLKSST